MKKNVIEAVAAKTTTATGQEWLDLDSIASVEVTSEDPRFPVESVFSSGEASGWRAAKAGPQLIRLLFHTPQSIRQIHLEFSETEITRMQEFTLRWSSAADAGSREIVRQQWNFSPQGSTIEVENYQVNLAAVSMLELSINPELSGGPAVASLAQWRVA